MQLVYPSRQGIEKARTLVCNTAYEPGRRSSCGAVAKPAGVWLVLGSLIPLCIVVQQPRIMRQPRSPKAAANVRLRDALQDSMEETTLSRMRDSRRRQLHRRPLTTSVRLDPMRT